MSKKKAKESWQDPISGGVADNRAYRQFVASSSKDTTDNIAVAFGQFNEAKAVAAGQTKEDLQELQRYKAEVSAKSGPIGLRLARAFLFIVALLTGFFLLMVAGAEGGPLPIIRVVCIASALLWLVLRILPNIRKK